MGYKVHRNIFFTYHLNIYTHVCLLLSSSIDKYITKWKKKNARYIFSNMTPWWTFIHNFYIFCLKIIIPEIVVHLKFVHNNTYIMQKLHILCKIYNFVLIVSSLNITRHFLSCFYCTFHSIFWNHGLFFRKSIYFMKT